MKYDTDQEHSAEAAKEKRREMYQKIVDFAEGFQKRPEEIAQYLVFAEKFSTRYSPNNTALIYKQNPGATLCQSFAAWKAAGYSVKRGEHGMQILVPVTATVLTLPDGQEIPLKEATKEIKGMYRSGAIQGTSRFFFRVGTTFDIAQTTFPPEQYPALLHRGYASWEHGECVKALIRFSEEELHCPVIRGEAEREIHGAALYGFYIPARHEIHLANTLQDTAALSTLTHELGHALLHHEKQECAGASTAQIKFEADCMRVLLSTHLGFDLSETAKNHLADHFRAWQNQTKEENFKPEESFNRVFDTYKKLLPKLETYLEAHAPGHMPKINLLPAPAPEQEEKQKKSPASWGERRKDAAARHPQVEGPSR